MEQRVQVITTVSIVVSASGIAVAEPCRSSVRTAVAIARRCAIASKRGEGSIPITISTDMLAIKRKVQSRADPDFKHPPARFSQHLAPIFRELALAHDQIEDAWQNPVVVETHGITAAIS